MISPYGHDRGLSRRGKWMFFLSFIRVVSRLEVLFTDVCIQLLFWCVFLNGEKVEGTGIVHVVIFWKILVVKQKRGNG